MVKCTVLAVCVPMPASWVRSTIKGSKVPREKEIPYYAKRDCSLQYWFAVLQSRAVANFPVQSETPAAHHGALSQYDLHTVLQHLLAQLKVCNASWCLCHAKTHPLSNKKVTQQVTCVTVAAVTAKEGRVPHRKGPQVLHGGDGQAHARHSQIQQHTKSIHWGMPLPQQKPVYILSQALNAGRSSPKLDQISRADMSPWVTANPSLLSPSNETPFLLPLLYTIL